MDKLIFLHDLCHEICGFENVEKWLFDNTQLTSKDAKYMRTNWKCGNVPDDDIGLFISILKKEKCQEHMNFHCGFELKKDNSNPVYSCKPECSICLKTSLKK